MKVPILALHSLRATGMVLGGEMESAGVGKVNIDFMFYDKSVLFSKHINL